MSPAAHGLSSSLQLQTKERRHLHSIKKERKPKGKQKGEYEAEGIIFFFFPLSLFLFFLCSACSCQSCWKLLPTDRVSSSFCVREFCRFYEPCKRGSGKRRREQENDQFSRALALSLIWSGSLGFNSMSQSG